VYGYPDEADDQLGDLHEGEPVLLLGEKIHWREETSLKPDGHYIYRVLTRLGVGWVNDSDLGL
jgi:hypothetical protein